MGLESYNEDVAQITKTMLSSTMQFADDHSTMPSYTLRNVALKHAETGPE